MSNVNLIQSAIMQLEGGAFQKLFDEYLYKKYKFKNIQTLGVQTATNKPTKGTPDSYVLTDDGKYILINYGSVSSQPAKKIQDDILSCFDKAKLSLSKDKIKKIICGHCSTNISIEQFSSIKESIEGIAVELIGIDTLSHDLALIYPHIAKDELGIPIDTNQFFDVEDFVKAYDANGINAPLDCEFLYRESEISETYNSVNDNKVTILTGPSGIGKTRLALEVCRKKDEEEVKVYCIKSNGNMLYEDIKYYISDPGQYLIFFDDANMVASLDNVLNSILTLSEAYKVKVLITVRDYAQDRVINLVSKHSTPNIIEIGRFKNDEIEEILKNDLEILNPDYLKKITEIANGNIRLAVLAGIRSIEYGYPAIKNAEDIFKNYYGRVIDDAKLTKDDIMMLFFIAVAGPVKGVENQLFNILKKSYGNEIVEKDIVENLYSLELVDWFKNEITKISDQSLGNYIMYYVLFEKKWISVESLISIGFPHYRNKVIYVLNTLMEIFDSEELSKYVENSIISAWENAPTGQEMEYLESFYRVDPDKALSIIKNHIDQENTVGFDLRSYDIDSKKNYHNISTKEIEILGGYKYTDNFDDAIDLLMLYFTKRPDLIMDFYFVLSERLLYDKYSWKNKYSYEFCLLDKLWSVTEEGANYNNSILYLQISEYALKTEISFTEAVRNSRSVNFVRMTLGFTEEIATMRTRIWKNLAILRKNEEYRNIVNSILEGVHFNGLNEEDSKKYLQSDFDAIYENVIDKDNFVEGNPMVPTVQVMNRYGERDRELKDKVIEAIVNCPKISAAFLGDVYYDEEVEIILHFFRNDLDALTRIYMNAIENSNHVDYDGKLFIKIFEQRPTIWNEYVDWAKDNIHRDGYEQKIFELIWTVEQWRECVDYAYNVLADDDMGFLIEEPARLLFAKSQDGDVLERKKLWLFDKLHERSMYVEKCKNLIDVVVTVLPDWKLEYILEFLKENKKPEDFEKLHLFPLSYSWSGSEVPLILEKIEFLQSLKDSLKGIDYIDHRKYLEERRRSLEKYQEEVELREYLENADYA